jgi:hypothetical protein
MSANGTTTAIEYHHDLCSCHCSCQHEEQTTSSTTVQLAQRFDQAMESAADSWNKVRQQTERAATDFRNTIEYRMMSDSWSVFFDSHGERRFALPVVAAPNAAIITTTTTYHHCH